jgi:hypothetical protein
VAIGLRFRDRGCGVRNCEEIISFTVRSNDIRDLAHVCLNWHTPIPIWACRYHRGAEPCADGNSNDVNDLASPGRGREVVAIKKHSRDRGP